LIADCLLTSTAGGKGLKKIVYEPIGTIHTPFKSLEGMPIQPKGGRDIEGVIKVDRKYEEALSDLEGFSHIILIYHLHLSRGYSLKVTPFLDTAKRGVFATRAPRRPNPIGVSLVRLKKVKGNKVYVKDIDIADGTPLLDIKPYVGEFDHAGDTRAGWLEGKARRARCHTSDKRFKG
jgi:tRNA-Thr(GGU) m(6)t(6)A37 methyltransferase TsaA